MSPARQRATQQWYLLYSNFRLTDIVVSGLRFHRDSIYLCRHLLLLSFFLIYSSATSELAEWNSTKTGHMLGSDCDLKAYVLNPQTWARKPLFRRLCNLAADWTASIFWTKQKVLKCTTRQVHWKPQRSPTWFVMPCTCCLYVYDY